MGCNIQEAVIVLLQITLHNMDEMLETCDLANT